MTSILRRMIFQTIIISLCLFIFSIEFIVDAIRCPKWIPSLIKEYFQFIVEMAKAWHFEVFKEKQD